MITRQRTHLRSTKNNKRIVTFERRAYSCLKHRQTISDTFDLTDVSFEFIAISQLPAVLRPNADPNGDVPGDCGVPRAADRGDVTPRLPLEAAGGDGPRRDGGHAEDEQALAQAHTAGSCGQPFSEQGICA